LPREGIIFVPAFARNVTKQRPSSPELLLRRESRNCFVVDVVGRSVSVKSR